MGPGTYTAQTMIAADALGLPLNRVRFELGESSMPNTPPHGGSMTTASVGSAVHEACLAARGKALALARTDARSPLHGAGDDEIAVADGQAFLKRDPSRGESYAEILGRSRTGNIEATVESNRGEEGKQYSMRAFGAHFVEVRVDPDLGQVRVARIVSAIGAGRIVNPKTSRSQLTGGMVGAIGMALTEETHLDHRYGRIINPSLAEYHVPVNADVPDIETIFIEEADPHVNPLGAKGVGEIAIIGAAAITNAIFHATGKRVRELPITPDKLL
jgi:xanthine dehydrogenase YagR molybdenum-binding subunit